MHRNAKRSKSGQLRNQSSKMPRDCVVFTSLILMMRNSRMMKNARRIISITDDSCKSNGRYIDATRMRRTSSRCSTCLHTGQNGRCIIVIEKSKVRMSRHLDTSTKAQMAQITAQHGRPGRSSWTESVRSSFGRTIMGTAIRESSIRKRLGRSSKLRMFFQ